MTRRGLRTLTLLLVVGATFWTVVITAAIRSGVLHRMLTGAAALVTWQTAAIAVPLVVVVAWSFWDERRVEDDPLGVRDTIEALKSRQDRS